MKKIVVAVLAGLVTAGGAALMAGPAQAAPITCPGGQTVTKADGGGWYCQNNGEKETGAGWHKGHGAKI